MTSIYDIKMFGPTFVMILVVYSSRVRAYLPFNRWDELFNFS